MGLNIMARRRGEERLVVDLDSYFRKLTYMLQREEVDPFAIQPAIRNMLVSVVRRSANLHSLTKDFVRQRLHVLGTLAEFEDELTTEYIRPGNTVRYVTIDLDNTMVLILDETPEVDNHAFERYLVHRELEGEVITAEIKRLLLDFRNEQEAGFHT